MLQLQVEACPIDGRHPPTADDRGMRHRVRAPPQPAGRFASFRSYYVYVRIREWIWEAVPVLVAESLEQHQQGLTGIDPAELAGYAGMLFTFPCDTRTPVSMTGMAMPLDVAFLTGSGVVGSVAHLQPEPVERRAGYRGHLAPHAFRHALELLAGGAARFGVTPGVRVEV